MPAHRMLRVGVAALTVLGCARTPRIDGAAGAPPSPAERWPATASVRAAAERDAATPPSVPASLADPTQRLTLSADALQRLTLADAVDLALRNNPQTRQSWSQARAAAEAYGSTRGSLFPTAVVDLGATRSRALAQPGRPSFERTQFGPTLSLTFLALDLGGRSANIEVAKQTAIAADLAHNAQVENAILRTQVGVFSYLAARALRDGQRTTVDENKASVAAAEERHRVGLATIADVLQARTALSQAQLSLEALDGQLQIARGTLAVAMGLPATTSFDLPAVPTADSVRFVAESVDSLIARAVRTRPELAQVRAQAAAASADVRASRSAMLPSLTVGSTGGYTGFNNTTGLDQRTYSLNLGLRVPVFRGLSDQYDTRQAGDEEQAALARLAAMRQQIALEVFTAYYALQTATLRVYTAADLLAAATQSESVASGRYKEGVGSIVDLLIAQSALATARAQDAQARWEWRAALAQLAHDAGALGRRGEPLVPLATDSTRPN